jgi:hypothetical protein
MGSIARNQDVRIMGESVERDSLTNFQAVKLSSEDDAFRIDASSSGS